MKLIRKLEKKIMKMLKSLFNFLRKKRQEISTRALWRRKAKRYVGPSVLTASQKKEIKEFYGKYKKADFLFHEFYTQKTGRFDKNYIPDDIYYQKIDPYFNNWETAYYLDNKCFYDEWYFKGINIPKTVVKRINGMWSVKEEKTIRFVSKEEAYKLISTRDCFAKQAVSSCGGSGVKKICKGTPINEIDKIVGSLKSDIVVQEAIEQSEEMNKLNSTSVNTVRVLSFLDLEGNVKVYSSIVRMGINGAIVDNASSGGITCGIESDGRLKSVGYASNGKKFEVHPSSGLKFSEVVIPNYNKILSLAGELHKSFPHFRLLSWDFAVDKNDEPLVIEVNLCYGELDFHQLNNGPLFAEDTEKILKEVFSKK